MMAVEIGPDWVQGIADFGDTVPDDLAQWFDRYGYELRGNSAGIEVAGAFIEVRANPCKSPSDVLRALAARIEEGGYRDSDFPEPDWKWLANEERVLPRGAHWN